MTHTTTNKHLVPLTDFPYLLVNKLGEVFDTEKGIYLESLYIDNNGYKILKNKYLHRLLAKQFLANPNNYDTVNHIDGNKTNNNINNIEWTTQSRNSLHADELDLTYKPDRKHTQEEYEYLLFERFFKGESILSISETVEQEQAMLGVYFREICEIKGIIHKYEAELTRQKESRKLQRKGAKVPHRRIQQIDPNTKLLIQEFKTISEPAKLITGEAHNVNGIKRAIKRGTEYKGYFWAIRLIDN